MVVTWASAWKSAMTGWFAGFIYVCWWSLNIFQMCWPHTTATYHRLWKNFSKSVFFPSLNYCKSLGSWLGSPLHFEARLGASLAPGKGSDGYVAQQQSSFAPVKPSLCPQAQSCSFLAPWELSLFCFGCLQDWGPALFSQPVYPWTLPLWLGPCILLLKFPVNSQPTTDAQTSTILPLPPRISVCLRHPSTPASCRVAGLPPCTYS